MTDPATERPPLTDRARSSSPFEDDGGLTDSQARAELHAAAPRGGGHA